MTIGDVLEVMAALCLVAAAYIFHGAALSLLAAAVCLAYLAQVHARSAMPSRRKRPAPSEISETTQP